MNNKIWKTKEGIKIPIKEMGDSHLLNTIKLLKRIAINEYYKHEMTAYEAMSFFQGECAISSIESQLDQMKVSDFLPPIYTYLIEEAIKRGIYDAREEIE